MGKLGCCNGTNRSEYYFVLPIVRFWENIKSVGWLPDKIDHCESDPQVLFYFASVVPTLKLGLSNRPILNSVLLVFLNTGRARRHSRGWCCKAWSMMKNLIQYLSSYCVMGMNTVAFTCVSSVHVFGGTFSLSSSQFLLLLHICIYGQGNKIWLIKLDDKPSL
jgi:hypothetical protein